MCGIAGMLSKNLSKGQHIRAASRIMAHRGPEGEAFYTNKEQTVALGHRRLSIIDLTDNAKQPMVYANRYHIVYNGELYNYIELRTELKKKGYAFTTESDTEVILAAYAAYGSDCLRQFDGMFAFALWDEQENKLFAARDRFGEKPFFFFYDEEQLIFASEMKALWQAGVNKQVNQRLMYNFLTIGYTSNPYNPQETFFEGIQKLPAASFLTFSLQEHQLQIEKYWEVDPEINHTITEAEAIEKFLHLFSHSIKTRLRSDVSIGTSLSGGLDSSAIVAFCDRTTNEQYTHKCFTAAFNGYEKDEQQQASLVARRFNLEHTMVEIQPEDIVALMTKVMQQQEEPVASASALAQYQVYKAAKQNGVTVVLDGQGADEILAGYHKYYKWYWQELYRQKKLSSGNEVIKAKVLSVTETFGLRSRLAALFPHLGAALQQSKKKREAFRQTDLDRDFAFTNKEHLYYSMPVQFDLNSALYFNTFQYGLEELLRLADRNSMAHSVEVRLPFLYHELVQFLFALPPQFKIHNGWTKWLLRKVTEPLLPQEIVWRKDKVGFEPPQKLWMQDKTVQQAIATGKQILVKQKILNTAVVDKKIQPHDAHAAENKDWKYWAASFLYSA